MSEPRHKPVIGLIGGIGAGKSTAAAAFARLGGAVVDADRIGHAVLEEPEIRARILQRWGTVPSLLRPDGRIDRRVLGAVVFANAQERSALESIMFPEIQRRCRAAIAQACMDPTVRWIVLDAAVLLEAGWRNEVDWLVYVNAPRAQRLERVAARGWTEQDLAAREAAQWPDARKQAAADAMIQNSGSLDDLQHQVQDLLKRWGLMP